MPRVATLSQIVSYADEHLRIREIEDWPNALNGLQVENSGAVTKIGAAVDASTRTIDLAIERGLNFLIVHHGLFWPGLQPISGGRRRMLEQILRNDLALYSAHLRPGRQQTIFRSERPAHRTQNGVPDFSG